MHLLKNRSGRIWFGIAYPYEINSNDSKINNLRCLQCFNQNMNLFFYWTTDLHYCLRSLLDPGCNSRKCLHSVPESQKPGVLVCQVRFAGQKCCTAYIPIEIGPRYLVERGENKVSFNQWSQKLGLLIVSANYKNEAWIDLLWAFFL